MASIKKIAAGFIAGAAITAGPLVAFAAPAFATTDAVKPAAEATHQLGMREQHALVDSASSGGSTAQHARAVRDDSDPLEVLPHTKEWPAGSQSDTSHVLVNAARCGGGINC